MPHKFKSLFNCVPNFSHLHNEGLEIHTMPRTLQSLKQFYVSKIKHKLENCHTHLILVLASLYTNYLYISLLGDKYSL